ncbi:MAG: imidazole glycerol phosphate synthase subunit HisF [Methanomicrobiales archaeon]|nr:imidazole glycerol phosphate synthase subunit HisF [Methanomicrobiales archaeon]
MFRPRIIPALLLKDKGLVKTTGFSNPKYIGDPVNAVRIFNEKEADELVFLDIEISRESGNPEEKKFKKIEYELIQQISEECLMPLSYGGGIQSIEQITRLFRIGIEKVIINTQAYEEPGFIREASKKFGSQSIIVAIDAKKIETGRYHLFTHGGTRDTRVEVSSYAKQMEEEGAGEILVNSIDQDGEMRGYEIDLIKRVTNAVSIPVIACGGAGCLTHMYDTYVKGNVAALAAGSLFVYHGKFRAVLINYPSRKMLEETFSSIG